MAKTIGTTTRMRCAFAAGSAALAIALAAPACAAAAKAEANADAAPAQEPSIKEIVVTAQFRSQKLQDTPISITAISSDLLRSRNQTDIAQIAAQAPNVSLTPMGGAYGSSMGAAIRGIGQLDFNPAYEPAVGMYIDDVYYATLTGGVFDLLDLERVEVLRGPQGTLTGRNSIGGAIKLFSKKPDGANGGYVEAAYGSRNRVDLRASANFTIANGLYARISGVYKRQAGYVDQIDYGCSHPGNTAGPGGTNIAPNPSGGANCVIDKLGERNYSGVRASLRYAPNDKLDWTVIGDYSYENRTNSAEVLTFDNTAITGGTNFICGRFCTYASFSAPAGGQVGAWSAPNKTKFAGWGLSSNLKYNLTDSLNFQSITAYREYSTQWGTDDDFTPYSAIQGQGYNDLKFHFLSEELRLNGKIGSAAEWTVGGFISDQKSVYYTFQDIRYIAPGLNFQFVGNDPIKAHSKAVYGTVILHPSSALTLTGGLRYTTEHKDYTFVRKNVNGTVSTFLGPLDNFTAVYDGKKLDWRISADYRFSPQILAYATVSTGFKGGGVTARPFDVIQAKNGSFSPETVVAYELGLKTDLLDRKVRLNLSGFINDYKNRQLPLSSCASLGSLAPCGAVQNAGSGKIQGLEAELSATPVAGLNIDASVSYLDGNWNYISPAVGTVYQLSDPIVTPNWKWSLGVQYKAELGSAGSLTPRFDINNNSRTSAGRNALTAGAVGYYPALTLANARLTWKNPADDLSVSLEVQNLFNKYYQPMTFAAVAAFTGTAYSQVGRPREWAITVRKTF
jgi:iron complex outermembrane receptor protein